MSHSSPHHKDGGFLRLFYEKMRWCDPFDLPENSFWAVKQVIEEKQVLIKGAVQETETKETICTS